jgi:ribokinase
MNYSPPIFVLGSFVAACSVKVERLPQPGETLSACSFTLEAGGKGFNVAAAARRLGAEVSGLIAAGEDLLGGLAAPALAAAGLPADMLRRLPGPSGAGVGIVDEHGENAIAVFSGANARLSADDVGACGDRLDAARFVIAQFEVGDAPIAAAFARGRIAGALAILNPSPYRAIDPAILANTDVLVVNRLEAEALRRAFELPDPEASERPAEGWRPLALHLFAAGVELLVITLGAGGALAFPRNGDPRFQPQFPVDSVDAIGAGDAFLGAFVAALAQDAPLEAALRDGAACGALATTRIGVADALPTRAQLIDFLAGQPIQA